MRTSPHNLYWILGVTSNSDKTPEHMCSLVCDTTSGEFALMATSINELRLLGNLSSQFDCNPEKYQSGPLRVGRLVGADGCSLLIVRYLL